MSVRTGERSEGTLQVLNDAKVLAKHTLQKCKSEKVFPKSSRWIMANRIMNECMEAVLKIEKANTFPLSEKYARDRERLQYEVRGHLVAMETLIDIALGDDSFHVDFDTAEYWTELIEKTFKRLNAWMKSDRERLRQDKLGE